MVIVPGSASSALAASMSALLDNSVVEPRVKRFADGEISVEMPKKTGDSCARVVILQSLPTPSSDNLVELMLLADSARRAFSPTSMTLVVPYLCYSRQDRVMAQQSPDGAFISSLSAKVIAKILSVSGAEKVVTVDLHSEQSAGFFDTQIANISAYSVFVDYVADSHVLEKLAVVAPDYGALGRVRAFVGALSAKYGINSIQVAVIDKYRERPGVSEVMHVVGNVKDRHCILLDDLVDSAGTLCNAAAALKTRGALSVQGFVTHGVLSGQAVDKVEASELDKLVVTDTIYDEKRSQCGKIKVQTVSALLADYLLSEVMKRK
ncbi:ribose-phosphate diphosphokinase [Anaplasma platys]|nr:ribose-phosphate diphosphokinase [Anaplasma platys]